MAESSSTITTSYVSSPIAVFAICRRRRRPSRKWQPNLGSRCAKMTFSQKNFPSSFDCPMWHAPAYSSDTPMSSAPSSGVACRRKFDPDKVDTCEDEIADAHALTPVRVLQLIRALGGRAKNLYLVGCEPARLDNEGMIGLSDDVRHAVAVAVKMIEKIITDFAGGRRI